MKEENFIHIKLDYGEALQSKKDILFSEIDLLRTLKIIKKYHEFRSKEFEIKEDYHKKLREILIDLRKVQALLPTIKIPKILSQEQITEEKITEPKITKVLPTKKYTDEIEIQLQEIKDKLKSLER